MQLLPRKVRKISIILEIFQIRLLKQEGIPLCDIIYCLSSHVSVTCTTLFAFHFVCYTKLNYYCNIMSVSFMTMRTHQLISQQNLCLQHFNGKLVIVVSGCMVVLGSNKGMRILLLGMSQLKRSIHGVNITFYFGLNRTTFVWDFYNKGLHCQDK